MNAVVTASDSVAVAKRCGAMAYRNRRGFRAGRHCIGRGARRNRIDAPALVHLGVAAKPP